MRFLKPTLTKKDSLGPFISKGSFINYVVRFSGIFVDPFLFVSYFDRVIPSFTAHERLSKTNPMVYLKKLLVKSNKY